MSGINPLIDTLLHQVLGKRVDTPPPRELNEPVRPVSPADALRALHSDSRLDARARSPLVPEAARPQREPGQAPAAGRPAGDAPPASTQIHFTPSARSIADVLLRFPAPPSSVQPARPLIAPGEAPAAGQLAERLQGSVRDSGLFYESHLARWYRGEMPRDQLLREPQMWRTQAFTPAPAPGGGQASSPLQLPLPAMAEAARGGMAGPERPAGQPATAAAPSSAAGAPMAAGAPPGAAPSAGPAPAATAPVAEGREAAASAQAAAGASESAARPVRDPVQESLQGIVRHQLELLVTPVLRWEGDVWTGLFMALVMHLPPGEQGEPGREEQDEGEERERQGWRSEMTLRVAGLGEVGVSLWLREPRLDLDLTAAETAVRHELSRGVERLQARLEACGLAEVHVRIKPAEEGP
ncbi:flagellar hook-length control protein FliK [Halomonas campaniensis]|uniref:flagellar hook-length control protein FliK n=1 Tax=Halomonas campaniensis TaxID=213554 RepID=UPI00356AD559